jgi:hypothetical protein
MSWWIEARIAIDREGSNEQTLITTNSSRCRTKIRGGRTSSRGLWKCTRYGLLGLLVANDPDALLPAKAVDNLFLSYRRKLSRR